MAPLRLAADENFNNDILRGLRQRVPTVDIIRVQDSPVAGADDPTLLAWAAQEQRILLTHDVKTMKDFAYARVAQGLPMAGVVEINDDLPVGAVIHELVLFVECSLEGEWDGRVIFFPLR